eukprot:TRINITY_DN24666_c0_g2_i1.p1 TRINITY_DN24666_c0_g2~~TRINITY_DN24666_c0_g2_i1.p1  ORF type:complete len:503 (-),score=146.77 TRINITY_DN24666_c0_g2_i1:122-1630(-)
MQVKAHPASPPTADRMAPQFDEEWAANPWQAQADAHMMRLQQAGTLLGPVGVVGLAVQQGAQSLHCAVPGLPPGVSTGCTASCSPAGIPGLRHTPATCQGDAALRHVHNLEGQIVLLEEQAAKREKEVEELQAQLAMLEAPQSPSASMLELEEMKRQNEFLTGVVARFEKKTMTLEEQAASLRRQLEDHPLTRRVAELEGLLAVCEEAAAKKDSELRALRSQQASQKPEELLELRHKAAKCEELSKKHEFLQGIITRFEHKSMDTEKRLKGLVAAQEAAEQKAQAASESSEAYRLQLDAARTEIARLQTANAQAEQRVQDAQEAAEGVTVALRDLKREHNRKSQDLLRKVQLLEKEKRELEAERKLPEATPSAPPERQRRPSQPGESAAAEPDGEHKTEVAGLKKVNAQLLERIRQDRQDHAAAKASLEAARSEAEGAQRENSALIGRMESLSSQLFELACVNDELQDEVRSLKDMADRNCSKQAAACPGSCCDEDALNSMS